LIVPYPPSTVKVIGTFCTEEIVPTSLARSATGPPFWPVYTSSSAFSCAADAPSSRYTAAVQLPCRMFPGTCASSARVRPATSTPSTVPLSKCQATMVSQVP